MNQTKLRLKVRVASTSHAACSVFREQKSPWVQSDQNFLMRLVLLARTLKPTSRLYDYVATMNVLSLTTLLSF